MPQVIATVLSEWRVNANGTKEVALFDHWPGISITDITATPVGQVLDPLPNQVVLSVEGEQAKVLALPGYQSHVIVEDE